MKNLSDEDLINQAAGFSCGCDKCLARVEPPRTELLSRLARGRKAIEFANALIKHRENGADLEKDGLIYNLIEEYQKLGCK
jgi:hypothetical protein